MITALFTGGPFDGQELGLAGGKLPTYLLLIEHPADPSYPAPIVVGADFDDGWPGQARYVLDLERTHLMIVGDESPSGEAAYRFEP
jgi:hypothetical protein